MQLSNGRKAAYIIISILISFSFWFYVNSTSNVDISINDIPVEFLNAESALANKGLVLISGDDATVDLVLNMPRDLVLRFDISRLRLIANLNSINSTGTQSLTYSIAYPTGVDTRQISVKSPTVQTISVRVGELFRKTDVEIRCKLVGNVADGYMAGSVQLLPQTLEVWGQQSDVMQVSYAQVTLNIENARSTMVELLEYELFDYNDQPIDASRIHSANDTVQVTMPVISATEVPLVVRFIEEPGVRTDSFDYSLDRNSVTLSGDANQIAELGEIVLGEVELAGISEEQSITYEIPIPDGLTNLSGVSTVTLNIANRDVATRSLTVTSFDYENFGADNREVEVVTSSLNVTLRGASNTLEEIDSETVTAVADLSGVTFASGTYTVPAKIQIAGDPDVGLLQNYQLTVRIGSQTSEGQETDASTQEPADAEQTEEGETQP